MKKTIIDLFENSVKQYPDNPFLWEKTGMPSNRPLIKKFSNKSTLPVPD